MSSDTASQALISARNIISAGLDYVRSGETSDQNQVFLYELAHATAALSISESFISFGENGEEEKYMVDVFCADTLRSIADMSFGLEEIWGIEKYSDRTLEKNLH